MNRADLISWVRRDRLFYNRARTLPVNVQVDTLQRIPLAGHNAAISDPMEGIWTPGGSFNYPGGTDRRAGAQLEVVSASGNDTSSSGTGMRKIVLLYERTDGVLASEELDMAGAVAVPTTNTQIRNVIRAYGSEWGSLGCASGNITIRIASGGATVEYIASGTRGSKTPRAYVPKGKTGFVWWDAGSLVGTNPAAFSLAHDWDWWRSQHVALPVEHDWLDATTTGWTTSEFLPLLVLPEYTRVEVNGLKLSGDDAVGSVKSELLLFDNVT